MTRFGEIKKPVRRAIPIATVLVLLPAFVRAPEEHLHTRGQDGHAYAGFFHSHLAHRAASAGTEFRDHDPDEDAHSLNWFHAASAPVVNFVAVLVPVAAVPLPAMLERRVERTENDPPVVRPSSPRAPPV